MLSDINISIRKFTPADAPSVALHANNRKVWEGVRDIFPHPYSEQDASSFIQFANACETDVIRAIDYNGKAIGAIGLHFKTDVQRLNGEIGYWLGEDFQGKGIATKVVSLIVEMAFEEYNLLRVYAEVFSNNPASVRVLEKNGFTLEARLLKSIVKDNKLLDLLVLSKMNPSWIPPKQVFEGE
jgi:[ribosomal protein S5]-alanine N-acetyltransferase